MPIDATIAIKTIQDVRYFFMDAALLREDHCKITEHRERDAEDGEADQDSGPMFPQPALQTLHVHFAAASFDASYMSL
jgi:hypothetical protein